jgi:hypothetical protein
MRKTISAVENRYNKASQRDAFCAPAGRRYGVNMKLTILLLLLLPIYTFASKITLSSSYPEDCEPWDYVQGSGIYYKEAMQNLIKNSVKAGANMMYLDRVDVTPITAHGIEESNMFIYTLYANTFVCKKP